MAAISAKRLRFVLEYFKDYNQTAAAIRAGYSAKSARSQASRLLDFPEVKQEVQRREKERFKRFDIHADRVLYELAQIGYFNSKKLFNEDGSLKAPKDWTEEIGAVITSLDVEDLFEGRGKERGRVGTLQKVKLADKIRALELLGKHLKIFTEKFELGGFDGEPLKIKVTMKKNDSSPGD